MRALQDQDFDKMAARVVDSFMGGSKLADAATQEAMGGGLSPDQIERLVQAANTQAFLRLMEQQKTQAGAGASASAPDMTHEFDPIDTRQIVQQIMSQVQTPHMGAPDAHAGAEMSNDAMPLPNQIGEGEALQAADEDAPKGGPPIDDNDGPFPKGDKQKSKDKEKGAPKKEPAKAKEKDEAKEAGFRSMRQRKLADIFEDQYKQAEWAFEDECAKLDTLLKRASGAPTLEAFEKNAFALCGDPEGAAVINIVRAARGLDAYGADYVHAKHAALVDRWVVDEDDTMRTFERLVKIAKEAGRLQAGAEWLRAQCS